MYPMSLSLLLHLGSHLVGKGREGGREGGKEGGRGEGEALVVLITKHTMIAIRQKKEVKFRN